MKFGFVDGFKVLNENERGLEEVFIFNKGFKLVRYLF